MEKAYLSRVEAAEYLGISLSTLQHQLRADVIPHIKFGRKYIIPKESLDRWMVQQATGHTLNTG